MAEGGGEGFSIETLSVSFRMLEEDVRKYKEQLNSIHEATVATQKKTHDETASSAEQAAGVFHAIEESKLNDAQKMILRRRESEMETQKNIIEMARNMGEEYKGIQENIIKNAEQNMIRLKGEIENVRQGFSGLKDTVNEVGQAIGVNFKEIASTATFVLTVISALGETRQMGAAATRWQAGHGFAMSTEQQGKMTEYLKEVTMPNTGVEMDEATKVFSQLGAIPGVTPEMITGGNGKKGLADLALFGAPGGGQTTDKAVDSIRTLVETQGMNPMEAGGTYAHLMEVSKQFGAASSKYVDSVMQVTKANSQYGLEVGNAAALTKQFWSALQEGKVTLEDIGKLATIGTRMPEGAMAFAATQILPNMKGFEMFQGQSAVGGAEMLRRVMFGNNLAGEHLGGEALEHRRQGATQGIFSWASNQAAGMGGSSAEQEAYTRKFLASMGINFSNLSPEKESALWDAMKTGKWDKDSTAALKASMQDPQLTAMENVGRDLREQTVGPLAEIVKTVKNLLSVVGHSALMIVDALTGREIKAYKEASAVRGELKGIGVMMSGAFSTDDDDGKGDAHPVRNQALEEMTHHTFETLYSRRLYGKQFATSQQARAALLNFFDPHNLPEKEKSYAISQFVQGGMNEINGHFIITLQDPRGNELGHHNIRFKNGVPYIEDRGVPASQKGVHR